MYKHILVPTDGSRLSLKAAREAARLARNMKAKVTAVYVIEPYMPPMIGEGGTFTSLTRMQHEYREATEKQAASALKKVEKALAGEKLACTGVSTIDPMPWHGILQTAKAKKCDVIVMASHGRGGVASILLGSETQKVLAHSKTPVLVCR
jgi:nucleotide-binding universal stress UspA family protein